MVYKYHQQCSASRSNLNGHRSKQNWKRPYRFFALKVIIISLLIVSKPQTLYQLLPQTSTRLSSDPSLEVEIDKESGQTILRGVIECCSTILLIMLAYRLFPSTAQCVTNCELSFHRTFVCWLILHSYHRPGRLSSFTLLFGHNESSWLLGGSTDRWTVTCSCLSYVCRYWRAASWNCAR